MQHIKISETAHEALLEHNIWSCGVCGVYHHESESYFSHEPSAVTWERLKPIYRMLGWSVRGLMPMEGGIPLCPIHTREYKTWMQINEFVTDEGTRPWKKES